MQIITRCTFAHSHAKREKKEHLRCTKKCVLWDNKFWSLFVYLLVVSGPWSPKLQGRRVRWNATMHPLNKYHVINCFKGETQPFLKAGKISTHYCTLHCPFLLFTSHKDPTLPLFLTACKWHFHINSPLNWDQEQIHSGCEYNKNWISSTFCEIFEYILGVGTQLIPQRTI